MNYLHKILLAAFVGIPLLLSAVETKKSYQILWGNKGRAEFDSEFQLLGKSGKDAKPSVQTRFKIEYTAYYWTIDVIMDEPLAGKDDEPDNILELFFTPTDSVTGPYYQFYGSLTQKNIGFFLRGPRVDEFVCPDHVQFLYDMKPGENRSVRIILPWKDFRKNLPLPDSAGKNAIIRLNMIRSRGKECITWCGTYHKPETWGTIEFMGMDEPQKTHLLRQVVNKLAQDAAGGMVQFDPERYQEQAFQNWENSIRTKVPELAAEADKAAEAAEQEKKPAVLPSQLYEKTLTRINDLLSLRTFVAVNDATPWGKRIKCPGPAVPEKPVFVTSDYVVPKLSERDAASDLYVTNINTTNNKDDLLWQVSLNGKVLASGNGTELPRHVKIGRTKTGDKVSVGFASAKFGASPRVLYAFERLHNGMIPGQAVNILTPSATDPQPWRTADGRMDDLYRGRIHMQEMALKRYLSTGKPPRLMMIGDSITDYFSGPGWTALQKYRPLNLGIEGDKTQNLLWRMDHWDFSGFNPALIMMLIGTNNVNDPSEEIARCIKMIIDLLQKKSPGSKILLLGVLPRGGEEKAAQPKRVGINRIISEYADGKHIFYMDIGPVFLDKNGKIDPKLMPDQLHPSQAGYVEWVKAVEPMLKKLIPDETK